MTEITISQLDMADPGETLTGTIKVEHITKGGVDILQISGEVDQTRQRFQPFLLDLEGEDRNDFRLPGFKRIYEPMHQRVIRSLFPDHRFRDFVSQLPKVEAAA
jgi:hypothetical protein